VNWHRQHDRNIDFDATSFAFVTPVTLPVYYELKSGQGLFLPQTNDLHAVTGKLRVTMTLNRQAGDFGEFIFGLTRPAGLAYPPLLGQVENYRGFSW